MCIGDYNAALNSTEKLSKKLVRGSQMNAFREALEHCHLEDLGFRGYQFTWNIVKGLAKQTQECG